MTKKSNAGGSKPTPQVETHFILKLTAKPYVTGSGKPTLECGAYMLTLDGDIVISDVMDKNSIAHRTGGFMVEMLNAYADKMGGVLKLVPITDNLIPETEGLVDGKV